MPIPTELVGSLPRPMKLQEAYQAYDDGKIDFAALQAEQDKAAEDSIRRLEETGETYVTDGEQRESSFATYPITDTLAGTGLADNLAGDGQFFAIFDDGHHRQLPRLTGGPFRYKTFASEFVEKNQALASKPVKQAVIAPSMLMLLYPLEGEIDGYSREQFLDDLCDEVEKDIRQAFAAGAVRVSIDFTEGRLANKNDSRNPWTNKDMLQEFIDLNNRVIDRFSPEERKNIGIHTCPGGDMDSVHSKEVPYEKLLSKMFQLNVGYFLIQCASEEDKENVYKLVGQYSRDDANGVPQVCFIGVINPLDPEVETAEEVRDRLLAAAKHIPPERLGATDDCGFSPFSRDEKPKHGSPDFARDIAMQKIANRVKGAAMASEELGRLDRDAAGREQERSQLARACAGIVVALGGGHDAALHEDVPLAGEGVGLVGGHAGLLGEVGHVGADRGQVLDARLVHRVLGVGDLEHHVDERAALEVLAREPLAEDVEDRQQPARRRVGAGLRLGLQPRARPALLATLEEREDELVLRREVAVERHLRRTGLGDDAIDPHRLGAVAAEEFVGGLEDPLTATGRCHGPSTIASAR